MKQSLLIVIILLGVVITTSAQSSYPTPVRIQPKPNYTPPARTVAQSPVSTPQRRDESRPRLKQPFGTTYQDQIAIVGNEYIVFRSGSNIALPLTNGAPLAVRLESGLSTSGMEGIEMYRLLPLKSPIHTGSNQVIAQANMYVETRISGHKAGFKDRAVLVVEPQSIQMNVPAETYIEIGEENGRRVFLAPGKWTLKLHCSIVAIEHPDGRSWYAKREHEGIVKGPKFGFERKSFSGEDQYSGLLYLNPYGAIAYGFSQVRGLVGFVFKRPNIKLPERTELHYRIERIEATYISRPLPKGPATLVQQ